MVEPTSSLASVAAEHLALHLLAPEDSNLYPPGAVPARLGIVRIDRLVLTDFDLGDPIGLEVSAE